MFSMPGLYDIVAEHSFIVSNSVFEVSKPKSLVLYLTKAVRSVLNKPVLDSVLKLFDGLSIQSLTFCVKVERNYDISEKPVQRESN